MPVYQSRVDQKLYSEYDPHQLAPGLTMGLPRDPRSWLLLGGRHDLSAGVAVRFGLLRKEAAAIRGGVVQAAVDFARREGLTALAFYVREHEVEPFRSAFGRGGLSIIAAGATLPVEGYTPEAYLRSLTARRRASVRRDWRTIEAHGLRTEEVPARSAIDLAAELVVNVKRKFNIPDHPRLVGMRLREWADCGAGRSVAFLVRDRTENLVAASFCCDDGARLEHYELGMVDHSAVRGAAYLEAAFYAPLRYAWDHRLTSIDLGLDAPFPKRERGAIIRPVWLAADVEPSVSVVERSGNRRQHRESPCAA
jgi:predicted N-acyltransferase